MMLLCYYICNYLSPKDSPNDINRQTNQVTFHTSGNTVRLNVEIADIPDARTRGLMNRTDLNAKSGMLFIFDDESQRLFWMKDTLISLDIIFLDKNKKIIHIVKNAKPNQTEETYKSIYPSQYAIEVNAGWCNENNVKLGDRVSWDF